MLLPMWTDIGTDDALELLGPGTVDSRVRAFAVRQLARADDEVRFLIGTDPDDHIDSLMLHPLGTHYVPSAAGSSAQI